MFTVSGCFDGANPSQDGVEQISEKSFIFRAFSETPPV